MESTANVSGALRLTEVSGDLTIERATELKSHLLTELAQSEGLQLAFRDVTSVDLSFLQLVCATHRMAQTTRKTFAMHRSWPAPLRETVVNAGYMRRNGCSACPDQNCLWVGGDN